jgi:hypothetical protein
MDYLMNPECRSEKLLMTLGREKQRVDLNYSHPSIYQYQP